MKAIRTTIILAALAAATSSTAQVTEKADVTLPFDLSKPGVRFTPTWGMDLAWINEQNLRKGINHMGKENITIGRIAFRTDKPLVNDSALSTQTISYLRQRANLFNIVSSTLPLVFTADQEPGSDEYFVKNSVCDINHWAAAINSHVHWIQQNTQHPVVGISPYNEPDYWTQQEGATTTKQWQLAKMLREQYPRMEGVAMVGGNTLNNDKALTWYTSGKQYYDWGNTHQLAGSFANYAGFFKQLRADGKTGYADEMHNVGDAMVGLEYGMTVGIWWGFDSRARGEFCQLSSHGERLAYGEHQTNWTAASVWRGDDMRTRAFIGSSERQAATTSYQFISLDRPVYFDGYGPLWQWRTEIPGGNGYQKGQTNAERAISITWGEDVPPQPITNGLYRIINKKTGGAVTYTSSGNSIVQRAVADNQRQIWNIKATTNRTLGDLSFLDIEASDNASIHLNVRNYSTSAADIIAWTQELPTSNEQWYLEYAGDGYYYIRNRESALYMAAGGTSMTSTVRQLTLLSGSNLDRQLWRIVPASVTEYHTTQPAQPTNLTALPTTDAISLSWNIGSEEDLQGYMVLRQDESNGLWNTIARGVQPPFVDNTCQRGHTYIYKVKAVDSSQNISPASEAVTVTAPSAPAMMAHWKFQNNLNDATDNRRQLAAAATPSFAEGPDGMPSLRLGGQQYLQLPVMPPFTADGMTVALWVNSSSSSAWQRIFDFGYDTDHYIFLTPRNGSTGTMRLAIKAGGDEQQLDAPAALARAQWKHVAVTISGSQATIYIDAQPVAHTDGLTIPLQDVLPIVNYIGRSQFNSDPLFTGQIADLRIYNHSLTAAEIAQIRDVMTGINSTAATPASTANTTIYNAAGQPVSHPQKGINIQQGKKVIR